MSALIVNFRPSDNEEWAQWAECAKPGAAPMYPSDADVVGIEAAKDNCLACPVLIECLESALKRGEHWGIWGGLTPDERNAIKRNVARQSRRTGEPRATAAELANEAARKFTAELDETEAETADQLDETEAETADQLDEAAGGYVLWGWSSRWTRVFQPMRIVDGSLRNCCARQKQFQDDYPDAICGIYAAGDQPEALKIQVTERMRAV